VVAGTDHDGVTVERFAPNGGTPTAIIGGLVVIGFIVGWAVDVDGVPLWVPAVALLGGVLIYASTIRPRVLVRGRDLVLRNSFSTTVIPLAAVDELAVRQVLAVRVGDKRHVCAGVGRSLRQAVKGSPYQRAREQMGGLRGQLEMAAVRESGMNYADYVEGRLQELVNEDRARRGVRRYSAEADELGQQVRRERAWPEIAALVATALFFVVALVVA
jgi:hypothetical protein